MKKITLFTISLFLLPLLFAGIEETVEIFSEYPEVLAVAFSTPITKAEMIDFCRENPEKVPEWLEDPYQKTQTATFARAFVESRELTLGAEKNGYVPDFDKTVKYLEKQVETLTETEQNRLDEGLKALGLSESEYIRQLASDKDTQKEIAEKEFMDMLTAKHVVTEEDITEYFQKNIDKYKYNEDEQVCFIVFDENGNEKTKEGEEPLKQRASLNAVIINILDTMKEGEMSEPFEFRGETIKVKKLALPEPKIGGNRTYIKIILEDLKAGDARGSLREMSEMKYNFEVPEVISIF